MFENISDTLKVFYVSNMYVRPPKKLFYRESMVRHKCKSSNTRFYANAVRQKCVKNDEECHHWVNCKYNICWFADKDLIIRSILCILDLDICKKSLIDIIIFIFLLFVEDLFPLFFNFYFLGGHSDAFPFTYEALLIVIWEPVAIPGTIFVKLHVN